MPEYVAVIGHNGGPPLDDAKPLIIKSPLVSFAGATTYLAVSKSKLYDLLAAGIIPAVRIGDRRLLRLADLDAFIEANMERGTRQPMQPSPKPKTKTAPPSPPKMAGKRRQ